MRATLASDNAENNDAVRREHGGARRTASAFSAVDQVVFFVGLVVGVCGTTRGGGPTGGFKGGVVVGGNTVPGTGATLAPGKGAIGAPGAGTIIAPGGAPIAWPSIMAGPSIIVPPAIGAAPQLGQGSLRNRLNSGLDVPQHPAVATNVADTTAARQFRNIAQSSSRSRFPPAATIPQKPAGRKHT